MSLKFPASDRSIRKRSSHRKTRRRRHLQLRLEPLEPRRMLASMFIVDNTSDSGAGSLRQAILDANASLDPTEIHFQIPASDVNFVDVDTALSGGDVDPDVFIIRPLTSLPALNNPSASIVACPTCSSSGLLRAPIER